MGQIQLTISICSLELHKNYALISHENSHVVAGNLDHFLPSLDETSHFERQRDRLSRKQTYRSIQTQTCRRTHKGTRTQLSSIFISETKNKIVYGGRPLAETKKLPTHHHGDDAILFQVEWRFNRGRSMTSIYRTSLPLSRSLPWS